MGYPISHFFSATTMHGCMKKNGIYRYIPKKYCHIKKHVFFGIWEMKWNIPILICHIVKDTHGRWYGISHFKTATSCATHFLGYWAKIGILGILTQIHSQIINLNKRWWRLSIYETKLSLKLIYRNFKPPKHFVVIYNTKFGLVIVSLFFNFSVD